MKQASLVHPVAAPRVSPHQVTKDFEAALCAYTGAPYAVAVNSCTMALLLACAWHMRDDPNPHNLTRPTPRIRPDAAKDGRGWTQVRQAQIEIPKRTYVSVPMSIIHAGGWPVFRDEPWEGTYQLKPYPIWDSARWFSSDMYGQHFERGAMVCVSFHWSKTLGIQQGGAILHDDPAADAWLRRARFDGRREGVAPRDDEFDMLGWHCYMSPEVAAEGLVRLAFLPRHNAPLPNDDYPDLSRFEVFK
jgi:hypothetical protein